MKHWAAAYVGRPWSPSFNCWALVREVMRDRWGVDMPSIAVGEEQDHVAEIKRAAESSGWRRAAEPPAEADVVLCRDFWGRRHCGIVVASERGLQLLHNEGRYTPRGSIGCVQAVPLREALPGLAEVELWRRAA